MRYRWDVGLLCVFILLFAQACVGTPPVPSSPAASGTPTDILATGTPTAAGQAGNGVAPSASPARPLPTPTEPRLGINPPRAASPARAPNGADLPPIPTLRGQEATISQTQGDGARSPFLARLVRVTGVVTADFRAAPARGFFMQEPVMTNASGAIVPRADTSRSSGIFVFQGDRPTQEVNVGDLIIVTGVARESDGRTEIDISLEGSELTVQSSGNSLPPPVELQPPSNEDQAQQYYERLEGMLVSLPQSIVVSPTARTGEFRVVRADSGPARVFAGDARGAGARIAITSGGRDPRYQVATGDQITGIVGPLNQTSSQYQIHQIHEARLLVQPAERALPLFAPARANEFTVASLNLGGIANPIDLPDTAAPCAVVRDEYPCPERVTPADYNLKLAKAALTIRDALGAPALVAVQEVQSLKELNALAARPELAPFAYGVVLLEGPDSRAGNVGLLYRRDQARISQVTQRNACTTEDFGFTDADAKCDSQGAGQFDGHYLATRPPLVVTLTVWNAAGTAEWPLTVIVTHFTPTRKNGPAGRELARREEEARLVAGIVNDVIATDANARVLVLGNLNDAVTSEPLRILTATAPLRPLTLDVPEPERYSIIVDGESQALDHLLVTPNLYRVLVQTAFTHINADYPDSRSREPSFHRVSGHDPPVARFRLGP